LCHLSAVFYERIDERQLLLNFQVVNQPHDLLATVLHVAGMIQDRLETALEPTGLSLAKLGALKHLAESGEPLPLGQLAERIACVKSNVTQLVDRLEADQLVRRVPDPSDRRSVRAEITAEGFAKYEAGMRAMQFAEAELVSDLELQDRAQLLELLSRFTAVPQA
jgi:DNA-binding MarR family transcriptional regulator